MNRERVAHELAEALNEKCNCVSVPLPALRGALQSRLGATGVRADLSSSHPHLFSQAPVFIAAAQARRMAEVIRAVEVKR